MVGSSVLTGDCVSGNGNKVGDVCGCVGAGQVYLRRM